MEKPKEEYKEPPPSKEKKIDNKSAYEAFKKSEKPTAYKNNDNPYYVLMVAEKPSIALAIAEAIAGNNYQTRKGF